MRGINKAIVAVMIALSVMISVLFCSAFAACGEEPASPPEPEPTPPTEQASDIERKVFQFTPEYSGEYIFFGNIYFGELEVITNEGDDLTPDADGEYRLTAGTPYTIAIEEPKFRELKLEYDISDDREVTLAPGEERIVKLGKIYDEVKTITTGNDSISISGIYTGAADDLEEYGYSPDIATSSYTLPMFDSEYYIVLSNDGTEEKETEILLKNIDAVTFDGEGNASYDYGNNDDIYIRLQDIPRGH